MGFAEPTRPSIRQRLDGTRWRRHCSVQMPDSTKILNDQAGEASKDTGTTAQPDHRFGR